jgi:hypothetical protein
MSREQTREILGLDRSWIWGGISARSSHGAGKGYAIFENYTLGTQRLVEVEHHQAGFPPRLQIWRSAGGLHLRFRRDPGFVLRSIEAGKGAFGLPDEPLWLETAIFSAEGQPTVTMPGSR